VYAQLFCFWFRFLHNITKNNNNFLLLTLIIIKTQNESDPVAIGSVRFQARSIFLPPQLAVVGLHFVSGLLLEGLSAIPVRNTSSNKPPTECSLSLL
jgi:hypothetical protein